MHAGTRPPDPLSPGTASLQCHRCGYELAGMPPTGKAVICPECSGINSFDADLQAKLRGDYGVSRGFCGLNRGLFRLAILCGAALIIVSLASWSWIPALIGILLIAGAITLRRCRADWFVGDAA